MNDFIKHIGINSCKLGSINAASIGYVINKHGKVLATCIDTPNSAAHAFSVLPDAVKVVSQHFTFTRNDKGMDNRIKFVEPIHGKYFQKL